jgi:uncharacterized protein YlaI
MKTSIYITEDVVKEVYFCPICHREIKFPFKGNIKIKGSVNINCGNCKKGRVSIKTKESVKNGGSNKSSNSV